MRNQYLAILMLSAFAIFFSLQHEGNFSFREAWFHLSDEYPIKYEADRLPPPIVSDLNGDGKKEILVATHDAKIQVLEPHSRRVDEGFSEAKVLTELSLLPDKIRLESGRRAIAMATGVIDTTYKDGQPLKQVLVVVTTGWTIMCFDHNLKKLWETNLQEDFPHNAHHREIAISISNYTVKHGDTGLIIVGGRMEVQPHSQIYVDPERNAEKHRRSATEKEDSENSGTVDLRRFAFYAFAGRSGILRWSRKNENIEPQSSDASQLIPQHNYKLDVHSLNSRHHGEFECSEFRESVLGGMQHHWDRREDTRLELSHFRRHRRRICTNYGIQARFGEGSIKKDMREDTWLELSHFRRYKRKIMKKFRRYKRKIMKKISVKSSNYTSHSPEENHPRRTSKKFPNLIGITATFGEGNIKKPVQYIPTITNHTQLWLVPNVVVFHGKEGIEVVHLVSGRTLCKLHLQEGGLHADINGDRVLDRVQAVGENGTEQTIVSGSMDVLQPCWAVATSGVPVPEQLFNASICHDCQFEVIFSFNQDRREDTRLGLSRFRYHRRRISTNFGIEARFGEENIKKDMREDTRSELSHFRHHKRKIVKKFPVKSSNYPSHRPEENHPRRKYSSKKFPNLIGIAAKFGAENIKKPVQYIPTITNHTQLWWVPNVVVAHGKEGIEVVHLASGRIICKLHLQEGGLHADINGDAVLDHVQAVGGNGAEQTVVSGSMDVLRPCWAVATSGVPVRKQLFNASICHDSQFNLFQHGEFSRSFGRTYEVSALEVATPILIPRDDGHRHRKGSHDDVVFLTNRGEVTSYSSGLQGDAIWNWQLSTGATWSNLPSPSGLMEGGNVVPTLKAFSLRVHDNQQMILAAGDQEAVVISPTGSKQTTIELPGAPTHALICDDFSNDGLTDLIVVTSNGVYGFVQTRSPGALFFSTLVGCLIIVMGVIFVSQHLDSKKGNPRSSGT